MNRFLITARIKTKAGDYETKATPAFFMKDGEFGGEDIVSIQIYHGNKGEEALVETLYLNHTPVKHTQIFDQTKEFNRAMDSNKHDIKPTMAEIPVSKEWGERIKTAHKVGEHEPKDGELLNTEKCSNPNCLICYGPKI